MHKTSFLAWFFMVLLLGSPAQSYEGWLDVRVSGRASTSEEPAAVWLQLNSRGRSPSVGVSVVCDANGTDLRIYDTGMIYDPDVPAAGTTILAIIQFDDLPEESIPLVMSINGVMAMTTTEEIVERILLGLRTASQLRFQLGDSGDVHTAPIRNGSRNAEDYDYFCNYFSTLPADPTDP